MDSVTGSTYQPAPQLVPFYKKLFSLYGNTAGTPLAVLGCPFNSDGTVAGGTPSNGNGCANRQSISHSSDDREQVQTARIDYNIDAKNMAWFRFQSDTGLQAAYTDPINPLFNAISPQPLYSFASGYTHVFSGHLVNYFNPAFSWYESLFGPADFQKTLAAFPIVLQGSGANAPFTTLGGLDNTWVQGRRAARFFINDNLAWTVGAHELRFGTNSRIFRLNDYDFGEGAVPLVTYTTLPQFIYGVASTASATFPLANSQPYNFLNLDFYAQDTWKVTRTLTWTFGIRDTYNSNPLNPHNAVARLAGSFDSISHDVNQPLSQVIRTQQATIFAATPAAILQPRTAIAWQVAPHTVLRSGFGLFSDLLPGSVVDLVGTNPPYSKTFQGGLLGHGGRNSDCAGSSEQRHRCDRRGESAIQLRLRARPALLRLAAGESGIPAFRRFRSPPCRTASSMRLTSCSGALRWNTKSADALNLRAQYVGTRAVNQPYETQVNGYQTVCQGCFAPFPYGQPNDPRFGPVTQLNTGANSHYNGLQLTADKRLGHGIQVQANYTWSHCMDTVSNGGFLPFAAGAILSPLPGELGRQYGPCDYDVRHNFTAQYVYQLPIKFRNRLLARALNGWQVSGTVFWHSGLPFSVLSAPYSANGNGIVQGSGPQYASVVPGVPLVRAQSDPRRYSARNDPMAQPGRVCFGRRSKHRRLCRRRQCEELPVRQSRPECTARS